MPTLPLTLAGRKRNTGSPGAWLGSAIVQLDPADGEWKEKHANDANANSIKWYLREYDASDGRSRVLFHVESSRVRIADINYPARGILYRSLDRGETWTDVTPQSGVNAEYCGAIAQGADGALWCATDEREFNTTINGGPSRVYRSTDDGDTWTLSLEVSETSFTTRGWPIFHLAAKPLDADVVVAEGAEMVGNGVRLWRTTDGGDTWSAAFGPTAPDPPAQFNNPGGGKQHVFDYTQQGTLVYGGIFETANDDLFILTSADDGDTFTLWHSEVGISLAYGAELQETVDDIYLCFHHNMFRAPTTMNGGGAPTELADTADGAPFTADHDLMDVSRHEVSDVDTLHLGANVDAPDAGATDDPSVFTRPADLTSGWAEHASWGTMNTDLGYRLYVGLKGLLGATQLPPTETAPPPRVAEPPVGPTAPVSEPARGEALPPTGIREKQRERRRQQRAVPTPVPQQRRPVFVADQVDRSQLPGTVAPIVPRRWLAFGWTTEAVLIGQKTLTLRDISVVEAHQWQNGELVYAYDEPPSAGGRRWALLRLLAQPYQVLTSELRKSDFNALGFGYLEAYGRRSPSGRAPGEIWAAWQQRPKRLAVFRFRVERLYDQLAPTGMTISPDGQRPQPAPQHGAIGRRAG